MYRDTVTDTGMLLAINSCFLRLHLLSCACVTSNPKAKRVEEPSSLISLGANGVQHERVLWYL